MRVDKGRAILLRKGGASYKEISRLLQIPRSTLSKWLAKEPWSKTIKFDLIQKSKKINTVRIVRLDKIRGKKLAEKYREAQREAHDEFKYLRHNELFIAGIMLYWGEGDKLTRHLVRLVNCDPEMIRLYVLFLRKICNVPIEKIRASLLLYPDLDDVTCSHHWSTRIDLPTTNFTRSTTIRGRGSRRNTHGMCTIVVSSTYFKFKMLEWLRLLPKELMT